MVAISAVDLWKRYGSLQVLRGLTLHVEAGEVYGLLGPNGSGKSTLMHLLLGFLRPDSGRVRVFDTSPVAVRDRVGYLPERVRYHSHFTAREYLRALGAFSDLRGRALADRCQAVLIQVGLAAVAERRLGGFSKGMLQRLGIAQALLHDSDLLLIDEPTSGLDPAGQHEMTELVTDLRRRGHTILLCSHQLAEVAELCDRVGILAGGRLAAQASLGDLAATKGVTIVPRTQELPAAALNGLRALGPGIEVVGREVNVGGDETLQRLALRALLDAEVSIAELKPRQNGLMELYLQVMHDRPPAQTSRAPEATLGHADQLLTRAQDQ